ncbi:O-antigen ligase family protein [Bacillus sp. AG4(2022)]|uniref:O-antigen ligase family protein n=1 Tax=Bacillus sp. AG4(2022) TaxID=2962594 RepID=UPI0028814737|nr:O-antigen ligase family protein [Bacillus sp. AG4(2022)]MDT0161599.1 O-antigen ligase family protein [Bacillus sp. AG4(2022)]
MKWETSITRNKLIQSFLIVIFTLLVFKITPISVLGTQWGYTLIEILITFFLILFWIFHSNLRIKIDFISVLLLILLFMSGIFGIRSLFGYQADFKMMFNLVLYLLIYLTTFNVIRRLEIDKKKILKSMYLILYFNIILSIVAYFNPSIFEIFNIVFETTKSATAGAYYQRFSGTFANPNFFGIFYAIIGICLLYLFITRDKKKIHFLIGFILSFYLVNISGSRSGLLTFLFLLLVMVILILTNNFGKIKKTKFVLNIILYSGLIVITLSSVLIISDTNNLNWAMIAESMNSRLLDSDSTKSNLMGRIEMASYAISRFTESPLIGVGPMTSSTDNQYARMLMESGVIFFGVFLLLILYILITRFRLCKNTRDGFEREIYVFTILATFALVINMFGAAIFQVTQLTSLFFFLLALNKGLSKDNHKVNKKIM